MIIKSAMTVVLVAALVAFCDEARAWGWGKNKEVTCYHDAAGQPVVLTREVCKLHYQHEATEEANLTYRTVVSQLKFERPDCTGVSEGWCAYQKEIYNQKVLQLAAQPNQAMQLVNNREEREHEKSIRRQELFLAWATFGRDTYVALDGSGDRHIGGGGISFRGDTVRGSAGGGAGGEGAGGGSEVGKQGDTYQVYVEEGARSQITLGASSSSGLESYEDNAQNRPALGEGASFTPTNTQPRTSNRTIGLGEVF